MLYTVVYHKLVFYYISIINPTVKKEHKSNTYRQIPKGKKSHMTICLEISKILLSSSLLADKKRRTEFQSVYLEFSTELL